MTHPLESCLNDVSVAVRGILEKSLGGEETSVEDGLRLSEARGTDLHALCLVADALRRDQVGDTVSYVVNRNINFTNVCIKNCKFCAFARTVLSVQGYFLPHQEVASRVRQAWEMGATEVCLQAGLSPTLGGDSYIDLCRVVKDAVRTAGAVPFEFNTIGVDDGIAMGHIGMRYSLPSRELIADAVETVAAAHWLDGLVCIPNCDKIVPGMLMAALRLNIPTIFVSGGPMKAGRTPTGEKIDLISVFEGVGKFKKGTGWIAKRSRAPVVPIRVTGAYDAWPRGQRWPRPGSIRVHYGCLLYTSDAADDDYTV